MLPSARARTQRYVDATAAACHLPAYTLVCRERREARSRPKPHFLLTRLVCRVSSMRVWVCVEEKDCANRVQQPKAREYQKKNDPMAIARRTLADLAATVRAWQPSANGAGGPASAPPHDHPHCAIPALPSVSILLQATHKLRSNTCARYDRRDQASMQHLISDCCPSAITGYAPVSACRSRGRSGPLLHTMSLTLSVIQRAFVLHSGAICCSSPRYCLLLSACRRPSNLSSPAHSVLR